MHKNESIEHNTIDGKSNDKQNKQPLKCLKDLTACTYPKITLLPATKLDESQIQNLNLDCIQKFDECRFGRKQHSRDTQSSSEPESEGFSFRQFSLDFCTWMGGYWIAGGTVKILMTRTKSRECSDWELWWPFSLFFLVAGVIAKLLTIILQYLCCHWCGDRFDDLATFIGSLALGIQADYCGQRPDESTLGGDITCWLRENGAFPTAVRQADDHMHPDSVVPESRFSIVVRSSCRPSMDFHSIQFTRFF